jgi:hypothetical protein
MSTIKGQEFEKKLASSTPPINIKSRESVSSEEEDNLTIVEKELNVRAKKELDVRIKQELKARGGREGGPSKEMLLMFRDKKTPKKQAEKHPLSTSAPLPTKTMKYGSYLIPPASSSGLQHLVSTVDLEKSVVVATGLSRNADLYTPAPKSLKPEKWESTFFDNFSKGLQSVFDPKKEKQNFTIITQITGCPSQSEARKFVELLNKVKSNMDLKERGFTGRIEISLQSVTKGVGSIIFSGKELENRIAKPNGSMRDAYLAVKAEEQAKQQGRI